MRDVGMCMGSLPGRKRKAMWVEKDGVLKPLAYFVSEQAYERFEALLSGSGLVQVSEDWTP
jgi:hypothetical protein